MCSLGADVTDKTDITVLTDKTEMTGSNQPVISVIMVISIGN